MVEDEQVTLGELAEIAPGPSGSLLDRLGDEPDGVPVVSPSDITDWNRVETRKLRKLPRDEADRLDRFALRQGDIVLVRQGSLGRLALIGTQLEGALYNSSCARVRSHDNRILPEYLCLYLSSPAMQEEMLRRALSGTVRSLNTAILSDLPVVVPPLDRQHDVVAVIADIDELALVHRETVDRLDVLKQALLDDFMDMG
ncbi:restriction endonuclease subunit S [Nocardia gipuzkoensis]|uniref:restriction endonuclease subunit S n=1 Tax=Nocardia gipuzkoensis TaxID=2749991 RepID=UPI0015EEBC40|nr:restriction endonuclease subunit S [Nocardia gipuzkoensis]